MASATRHPEYDDALPGWGAYKHADVKDAKRRRPEHSLEDFARARGLEFLDTGTAPGFNGVMPMDARLQFNVAHGPIDAGGRRGVLFHEVFAVDAQAGSERGPIGTVAHSYTPKVGKRFALAFVPVVGTVLDAVLPAKDKRPDAVGVPTTVAGALVPEAAAVPEFDVTDRVVGLFDSKDRVQLDRFGLGALTLRGTGVPEPTEDFVEALMAGAFGDALRAYPERAHFQVVFDRGRLMVRVDGYLEPDELDELRATVARAADGLASAASRDHDPRPFADPLPAAAWPEWEAGPRGPGETFEEMWAAWHRPPPPWLPWLRDHMAQHDGAAEDGLAFHRAFPRAPVPGVAFAVIRRSFPGTATVGRVAWCAEQNILSFNVGSNAVLLPAPAGTADTEVVHRREERVRYAVRDGVFCLWSLRRWQTQEEGMGDVDGLVEHALRFGRETGWAAL